MGDFNARVGRNISETNSDYGAVTSNTVGTWSPRCDITPNANGSLLIDIASENSLRHVSSIFLCTDSQRWSWRHPCYRSHARLDHTFVPATRMRFVSRSFVASNITIFTDHRLVVCEISFRPRLAKPTFLKTPRVDNRALDQEDIREAFQAELSWCN